MKKQPDKKQTIRARSESRLFARLPGAILPPALDSPAVALLIPLLLIALNLVVYAPAWDYGFLSWDDPLYVRDNAEVARGLTWRGFLWAFTTGHAANWHPLTWLSHMLDVQFFGMDAGLHHLTNILLHIANTLLLFWALVRMTGTWRPGAIVAALFAVHPLHVESVAWISERKDVLSAFFCMLTLHAYIHYARRPAARRYAIVLVLFALGLMAKPMLVTVPVLLLLLDFWPLGRAGLAKGQGHTWVRLAWEKAPLLALSAVSSIVTLLVQMRGGAVADPVTDPLGYRIANALVSYAVYIAKTFWPAGLAVHYPYTVVSWWPALGSLLLLGVLTFLSFRLARKHPQFLVGWFWYLIALLPVIGLIRFGDQARADRYTYLPLIGLFIVVTWLARALADRLPLPRATLPAVAVAVCCVLTAAARGQVGFWKNDIALWTRAVEKGGSGNHLAYTELASALADRGEPGAAVKHLLEAIRINPRSYEAHTRLGLLYSRQGRFDEALEHCNEAIRLNPRFVQGYTNRGIVYGNQGNPAKAVEDFRKALELKPGDAALHYNLGYALADAGRTDEAWTQFQEALRINPDHAQARNWLANILAARGQTAEAIVEYRKALRSAPDFLDAHINLGVALMNQNRENEALTHFREALRIDPNLARVHSNIGVLLINQGKIGEAIAHFNQALALAPDDPDIQANLRNALAIQQSSR